MPCISEKSVPYLLYSGALAAGRLENDNFVVGAIITVPSQRDKKDKGSLEQPNRKIL
jgi:hypothetical protein